MKIPQINKVSNILTEPLYIMVWYVYWHMRPFPIVYMTTRKKKCQTVLFSQSKVSFISLQCAIAASNPESFPSTLTRVQSQWQKHVTAVPLCGRTVCWCTRLHLACTYLDERAFLGMKAKSSNGKNSFGPMMPNPFVRFAWSLEGKKIIK